MNNRQRQLETDTPQNYINFAVHATINGTCQISCYLHTNICVQHLPQAKSDGTRTISVEGVTRTVKSGTANFTLPADKHYNASIEDSVSCEKEKKPFSKSTNLNVAVYTRF